MRRETRLLGFDERHEPRADHFLEEPSLRAEVVGDGAWADPRMLGDVGQRGPLVPVSAEGQDGGVEDFPASLVGPSLPFGERSTSSNS